MGSRNRSHRRRRRSVDGKQWVAIAAVAGLACVTIAVAGLALRPNTVDVSGYDANAGNVTRQAEEERLAAEAEAALTKLPRSADPTDVLFVGDSLTYGAFASQEAAAWRPLVTESLNAQTPINATWVGGSGKTSVDVTPLVPAGAFDMVVVEIGTNDATMLPEEALDANYRALIQRVRATSPDAALICLGSWQTEWRVSQTDPEIRSICQEAGGAYLPLGDLWLDEANRGPDQRQTAFGVGDEFHPNDAGHRAIADRVLAQIRVQ